MNKPKILKSPLTLRRLKNRANEDGYITVNVAVSLGDLLDNGIEGLNDIMDEAILDLDGTVHGSLADISYRVVGHVEGKKENEGNFAGAVVLEVTADVSEAIQESEELS